MSERVFIIINEWTEDDADYEVVYGDRFWLSEAGALVRLEEIARSANQTVPDGETCFDVTTDNLFGLERDTYYIRELRRG